MASVSVLISTFNRSKYLRECLDSILAQTVPPTEVIVVNDGSKDDTAEVLQSYVDRITVINQENAGKPVAINRAFQLSRGEYIWIFDDDDVACPDFIENHLAALKGKTGKVFSYGDYLRGITSDSGGLDLAGNAGVPAVGQGEFLWRLLYSCFLTTQGMLIGRECLNRQYVFKPELIRSQDYELFIWLARTASATYIAKPGYIRRFHPGERGSAADRFTGGSIEKKWYQYEKLAVRDFFSTAEEREFLPGATGAGPLEDASRVQALMRKATIAWRKGLWDDLRVSLRELHSIRPPAWEQAEAETIAQGFLTTVFALKECANDPALRKDVLARMVATLPAGYRMNAARGLRYQLAAEGHQFSARERVVLWGLFIRLLGIRGLVNESARLFSRL